ncbi:globin domain-containing protein [Rhodobacteraceae bacterium D3-12]|nr:globin domain-containing protein [Rhodobacteraceae bacterium D3-12]
MDGSPKLDDRVEIVFAHRDEIAEVFYSKLFVVLPEVQTYLFPDFEKQKKMFAMMVTMLARSIEDTNGLEEYAAQLAAVHSRFDITPEQFLVGGAVLKTSISEVLGSAITLRDRIDLNRAADRIITAMKSK